MNGSLSDRLPMSIAWLAAYAAVWSMFTAISVYVLSAEASPSHVEHLVVAGGFVMLALGSRALLGANAARAAAFAFAPMALFSFAASVTVQDATVFGEGDWCGTGRLSAAMQGAVLSLPMGALAAGLWFFFHLRGAPATPLRVPSSSFVAGAAVAVLGGLVTFSALRAATRVSVDEFRASVVRVESVPVEAKRSRPLENAEGYPLELTCRTTCIGKPSEEPVPPSEIRCAAFFAAAPDASETRVSAMPSQPVEAEDSISISRSPDGRITVFEVVRDAASPPGLFAVLLDGEVTSTVRVRQLAPALGPSWSVVLVTGIAALPLALLLGLTARSRRRVAAVLQGRDGELDTDGRVALPGESLLVDASLRGVPAGSVVVLRSVDAEDYRVAQRVTDLEQGTKRSAVEQHAELRREWTPVALVTALVLAAPVVASATLGLL